MILSQSKKILLSAVSVFVVSLSILLFFLDADSNELSFGKTDSFSTGAYEETEASPAHNSEDPKLWLEINAMGLIVDSSDNFCEFLNLLCENLHGTLVYDLVNARDLPEFASINSKLMQSGNRMDGLGPFRMLSGDSEVVVMFTAIPVLTDNGIIEKLILEVKDITRQVKDMADSPDFSKPMNSNKYVEPDNNWLRKLYPKVLDLDEENDPRMMVDNIM